MQSNSQEDVDIPSRPYHVTKCYGCQHCFMCGDDNQQASCSCLEKPVKGKNGPNTKSCFPRAFDPKKTSKKPAAFLRAAASIYGYNTNFTQQFSLNMCSTCNNKYTDRVRGKSKATSVEEASPEAETPASSLMSISSSSLLSKDENDHDQQMVQDSNGGRPKVFETKVQVDSGDKQPGAAKWLELPADDYYQFLLELEDAVLRLLPSGQHLGNDYTLTYKTAHTRGTAICLADEQDFKRFLKQYQAQQQTNKEMLLTVIINADTKLKDKKKGKKKRQTKVRLCK